MRKRSADEWVWYLTEPVRMLPVLLLALLLWACLNAAGDSYIREHCTATGDFRTIHEETFYMSGDLMMPMTLEKLEQRYQCTNNSVWLKE